MNKCITCGKVFEKREYQGGSPKKYCSVLCRVKRYYKDNKKVLNQRMKKYHSTEDFKIKLNAQSKLRRAVALGRIHKPKICSGCSKASKIIHGHHKDYSKPLDVIWLCPKCHANV